VSITEAMSPAPNVLAAVHEIGHRDVGVQQVGGEGECSVGTAPLHGVHAGEEQHPRTHAAVVRPADAQRGDRPTLERPVRQRDHPAE